MFYDHIYAIVTVHSIKDCQLSTSTATSFLRIISLVTATWSFEWGVDVESGVNLDYNRGAKQGRQTGGVSTPP